MTFDGWLVPRQRGLGLGMWLVAFALSSCSGGGVPSNVCATDADCPSGLVCRALTCVSPGTNDDGGTPLDGGGAADGGTLADGGPLADGGAPDAGTAGDGGDTGDGGPVADAGARKPFGAACTVNAECESEICLATGRSSFCTRPCSQDCPQEYECKTYVLPPDRLVPLCVPYADVYCVQCTASRDCPRPSDACTDLGGATYCTKDCSQTGACPSDSECRDVPIERTVEGRALLGDGGVLPDGAPASLRQCVPRGGLCPGCIDRDGDGYGVGAACLGPDCNDGDRDIHPGATEVCDTIDNNCDGRADEGFDIGRDANHCGGCNRRCAPGRACCGGECVDLDTSPTHCGVCDRACSGDGAACCAGECRATRTDANHCGACDAACTNEHGDVGCAAGVCAPACVAGFGDCDANPRNGCETPLTTVDHCGACRATCSNGNGTTRCTGGLCDPTCAMGFGDCDGISRNGCEQNLSFNDGAHCGACNAPCLNANGTTSCVEAACRPVCGMNYGDCDADARNGCEADLMTSAAHCGACGEPCAATNATSAACVDGRCDLTCAAGFYDCDRDGTNGCEADLSVVTTCGACFEDADCPGDFYCRDNNGDKVCTKKKPPGEACALGGAPDTAGRECLSNFCVDGVCCEQACQGGCRACNLTGSRGQCTFVTPGQPDPRGSCAGELPTSCGLDGTCDGSGGCRKWLAGTECVAQSCAEGTQSNARTCDGQGTCRVATPVTTPCTPYACGANACLSSCNGDGQCQSGYTCVGGVCKVAGGLPCDSNDRCGSGFCVDGVCCQTACNGVCERCDLPPNVGVCSAIPAGIDPDNDCNTEPVASCGKTGVCSGARSCALYTAATECAAQTCVNGVQTNTRACDGSGACNPGAPPTVNCFPYQCNSANQTCFAACSSDTQCQTGYGCAASGQCRKVNGLSCGLDAECKSGFCADGVCCDGRCNGVCEKCNQANRIGFCDPIAAGADPEEECSDQTASTCGRTGTCSGSRSCQLWPASTVCQLATCANATTLNRTDFCNGQGACVDAGTQSCGNYICEGTATPPACRTTCSNDTHCASGFRCRSGACLRDNGGTCGSGAQCFSGNCCSGICRDLTNDKNNCGQCGTVCQDNGTVTNTCQSGVCNPVCQNLRRNCNNDPRDGCETATNTLSNCGGCGTTCSRNNASATCATGSCSISSCNFGYDTCDGNDPNGCETWHAGASNDCPGAINLGSKCGDAEYACGFLNLSCCGASASTFATRTGTTSQWFRARATECSSALFCNGTVSHTITLTVPGGIDYDLYVYSGCGGSLLGSGTGLAGAQERVTVSRSDEAFDYWIEVRYYSGSSCSPWTLSIQGRDVP